MEDDELYIESLRCRVEQEKIKNVINDDGLSEGVLERQIRLNTTRHETDLTDEEEIIFKDEKGRRFVQ